MKKEEVKQWLRSQIDSCIKIQSKYYDGFDLCYNKQYLRALKLSKITGKPVNKNNFTSGEELFEIHTTFKEVFVCVKIIKYLKENYSIVYSDRIKILKEVFNEYIQYNGYNIFIKYDKA